MYLLVFILIKFGMRVILKVYFGFLLLFKFIDVLCDSFEFCLLFIMFLLYINLVIEFRVSFVKI